MAARPLLSFGANVEVLSPESVRADLATVAAEVVACYWYDGQGPDLLAGSEGGQT
jgi:hypothetical protein